MALGKNSRANQAINNVVVPGSWQTEKYFHLLEGKKVAVVGNHTSMVNNVHLVDTLLAAGINVVKVFSPEHGFRGRAAAGELIDNEVDSTTGLPIISLYGSNRRPTPDQLKNVDVVIFDIQDVGTRFYTYISTMTYMMQELARANIPMLILDRPNPNGHYMDGPVLELAHASFVGLHPVPVVHGMTIAEYAQMVNGEGWLGHNLECELIIIPVGNYCHNTPYELPLPPSPNLPNMHAIYLYPSLCFFEGTQISIGRGTDKPFQVFGHSLLPPEKHPFSFTPVSVAAAPNPPQQDLLCHGRYLAGISTQQLFEKKRIDLTYLIEAYRYFPDKAHFFNSFFENLAGNKLLREQIKAGLSEERIRESWRQDLEAFQNIRKSYLLYPDYN